MLKQKPTKKQIIALVFSLLVPVLEILFTLVWILDSDTIPNITLIVLALLVPLLITFFILLVLLSKLKNRSKTIFTVLLLLIFLFSLGIFCIIGQNEYLQVLPPEEIQSNEYFFKTYCDVLPSAEDIKNAEEVNIYFYERYYFIFNNRAAYLVCNYNEKEYIKQKDIIAQSYDLIENNPQTYYSTLYSYLAGDLGNYHFRLLSFDSYEDYLSYPKRMAYIITNDETKQIIYLSFYDLDLDYIENSDFENFINEYCGWKHIVKKIQTK